MAIKKILTKDERVKKEINRLKKIFKTLDKNKLDTVQTLIQNAAFMSVTLEDLQEIINKDGCTHEYTNGANQAGVKRSAEMDVYIAMTRNQSTIIKQLTDLAPPKVRTKSKMEALKNE